MPERTRVGRERETGREGGENGGVGALSCLTLPMQSASSVSKLFLMTWMLAMSVNTTSHTYTHTDIKHGTDIKHDRATAHSIARSFP